MIYKVKLEDYGIDSFKTPIKCGSATIIVTFNWDSVAQRNKDLLDKKIRRYTDTNKLSKLFVEHFENNPGYDAYMEQCRPIWDAWKYLLSYWKPRLALDFPGFKAYMATFVDRAIDMYVTVNYKKEYEETFYSLRRIRDSEDPTEAIFNINGMPMEFWGYMAEAIGLWDDVVKQYEELTERLRWQLSCVYNGNIKTTYLNLSAWHFYQDADYSISFTSDKEDDIVGYNDLGAITMWINVL